MITDITMKNCSPFSDSGIYDCKKVNFVFGENGTGKTTISQYLANLENQTESRYKDCNLKWSSDVHSSIRVYNRFFREANFKKNQNIPGVFTIGSESIQDRERLEKLRGDLERKNTEYEALKESLKTEKDNKKQVEIEYRDFLWNNIQKKYSSDFGNAFSGCKSSKDRFYAECKKRIEEKKGTIQSLENLKERASTIFSSNSEKKDLFHYNLKETIEELHDVIHSDLWSKAIVGNDNADIAKLIKMLDNSGWVRIGRQYLRDGSDICPFCQQRTISDNFRTQLNDFFNTEYEEKVKMIMILSDKYDNLAKKIISVFSSAKSDRLLYDVGKINEALFEKQYLEFNQKVQNNRDLIRKKMEDPSVKVNLEDLSDFSDHILDMINEGNEEIRKYNLLIDNQKEEQKLLSDDVWKTVLSLNEYEINNYALKIRHFESNILKFEKEVSNRDDENQILRDEITKLESKVVSTVPPIREINNMLKSFGFTNFLIASSEVPGEENSYQIVREDGTPVSDTLSEGEETFITFLYFLQLAKGDSEKKRISGKKILVIDDPISSLDSNILFVVSMIINDLARKVKDGESGNIEQIFILTHNAYFHKEVTRRLDNCRKCRYWVIKKSENISTIDEYDDNPIKSSYQSLWNELKREDGSSLFVKQNIMRRIIENYFSFTGQRDRFEKIENKMSDPTEKRICESMFIWLNDGSHSIPDDLDYYNSLGDLERYEKVFKAIFEETGNIGHYNMMMGIVD